MPVDQSISEIGDTMSQVPSPNQRWRYKANRGSGTFTVVGVFTFTDASGKDGTVTLRDRHGKDKKISLRTLRGDYEPVPS